MNSARVSPDGSVVDHANESRMRRRVQIWLLGLGFWAAFCAMPMIFAVPCEEEWPGTSFDRDDIWKSAVATFFYVRNRSGIAGEEDRT